MDQSGSGTNYSQSDLALRPTYRTGGGKPYVEFDGTDYLDSQLGDMNFAYISYHMGLLSTQINAAPFNASETPDVMTAPYYRWGGWHDNTDKLQLRINGTNHVLAAPGWQSANKHVGFDSVAGEAYADGAVLSTFPAATITYPNVTKGRIGASGWGTDFSELKVYGVLATDTGLSIGDVGLVNTWLQDLIY